jgi:PAS domain S-box-containing protein
VDKALHDMRNDLAVAIGTLHALIDGKLAATPERYADMLGALEDIDARLSAGRTALAASGAAGEHLLAAIIEGSPYANVLVDARGRIALVNAQAERLFGYDRAELLGQPIELLVPERFRFGHPELRGSFGDATVARPMGAGRDLYGRTKSGAEVPIEIGLNPIATGSERYTLAAITDISERRRADELRLAHTGVQQHAAELEQLNRELANASRFKTQFVATMSHELRTPLTAIVAAAELLGRARLDERAQISVQMICEASEALLALINSVLDFSKVEAGKLELQLAPFDVEAIVEGAADVVAQLARERGVTVYTYVEPGLPLLLSDAERVRQILLNLLGNAVKFTEHGHVVARVFSQPAEPGEIGLRFEVQDTGIGIAPDAVARLFEPFAQADGATARRFGGTGLGLSITKRLVELMGGEIGVDSRPGAGSLFWFTARFAPAGERPADEKRTLDGIGGIIVSHDDTFAEIVSRYMESWSMASRRAVSPGDVERALGAPAPPGWVTIVDLDNPARSALAAPLPDRAIGVGIDAGLHKPLRQSQLFDAIVKSIDAGPPVHVPAAPAPRPPAPPRISGPVLVAEDNARLQRLLKLQFDELGVDVRFVSDGLQAVAAVRNGPFAMVFMDCQMPNLDGLAATRAIRDEEGRSGGHVPIAAMTANAFAEDRAAALAAGMDDYLAKPVKLADLRATIERWCKPGTPA